MRKLKLTTFIDKEIPEGTLRKPECKPAITLLTDLYSAYLSAPSAPRPYAELEGMGKFLYFDPVSSPEFQLIRRAFEWARRVENHIRSSYYELVSVVVAFYPPGDKQEPYFLVSANLGRNGEFIRVRHSDRWTDEIMRTREK